MISLNPLNYLSVDVTNPTNPKNVVEQVDGKENKFQLVQATINDKKTAGILFSEDRYQFIKPLDNDVKYLSGKKGADINIKEQTTVGVYYPSKNWKNLSSDLPDGPENLKALAVSLITKEMTAKPVRLFNWVTKPVVYISSSAYNHPLSGTVSKWAAATVIFGGGLWYWNKSGCPIPQSTSYLPNIELAFLDKITIFAQSCFNPIKAYFGY